MMSSWIMLHIMRHEQLLPVKVFYSLDIEDLKLYSIPDLKVSTDIKITEYELEIIENILINLILMNKVFL